MEQHVVSPSVSSPARVDLYASVHKGLRAFMADTLAKVGRIDADDAEDVAAGLAQVRDLLLVCRVHLTDENLFIHQAIEARCAGASAKIALEHVHHEESLEALAALVRQTEEATAKAPLVERLYRALAIFVAENLEHMHVEETEHNAALWAAYSDTELLEIEHAIIAWVPPEAMPIFLRWMIPAMSHPQRVGMLGGMKQSAPPEAFAGVLATARATLSARDFAKLAQALGVATA